MRGYLIDLKKRPFHLLILTALPLLGIAIIAGTEPFDVNLSDTYYVMPLALAFSLLIVLLMIIWGLYKLTEKTLWRKWLTWLHVTITISILTFLLTLNMVLPPYQSFRYLAPGTALFIISQIFFIMNIVMGLIQHFFQKKSNGGAAKVY
jgi:hypothetical protein